MGNELRKNPGLNQEGSRKGGLSSASPGFTLCPQQEKGQKETLGPSPPPIPTFGQICQEQRLVKPTKYLNLGKTRPMKDQNTWFPTFPCFAGPQADIPTGAEPSSFPRGSFLPSGQQQCWGCKTSKPSAHVLNFVSAGVSLVEN